MASTYTNNGIELITTGEQSGTWGTTTNTNWTSMEAMVTGYVDYTVTDASTKTETIADGAADDFRNRIIKMTGTLSQAQTITIADTSVEKEFWVYNGTTGGYAVTFKQGTGANTITINNGNWGHFFVNGANDAEFFTPEQFTTISVTTAVNPDTSGGADLGTSSLEWGDVYVADNKFVNFGSDQDVLVGWNTTRTGLDISATEGAALALYLSADQGDDAGDEWKLNIADGGTITLGSDINSAGTFVAHLTITPNSTVASSTVAFAGNITIAGTVNSTGAITGTLATAAQGNVTSLGTLTALQVDSVNVNGATISVTTDTNMLINPPAGRQVVIDSAVTFDAGVVTGATSITSTAFVGTLSTAAQGNVTSLGTLTTLTIDNVIIDGTTIGHTGDTDLLTLASGELTVAGNIGITDDLSIKFGAAPDYLLYYDEAGADSLTIQAAVEGAAFKLDMLADQGDDNADKWRLQIADSGVLTWESLISGSFVAHTTLTPDSTVASSTMAFAGNVTVAGTINSTGTITGTLATAAQGSVTSLGTLTALTVDNIAIDGTTIGHTGDTDLMTLASGVLTVAGEISVTTLDIGGTNVTSTAAEINLLDGSSANSVVNSKAVVYGSSGELAGTLSTVAQGNVTSLGTLTALQVDSVNINGATISVTTDTNMLINPPSGRQVQIDGATTFDAGVVTGMTSLTVTGSILAANAAGPALLNEACTSTNPTINPNRADVDTGIGGDSNQVAVIIGGTMVADFSANLIRGNNAASGAIATGEAASATNPTLIASRADLDSGVGAAAANQLSLISGGSEALRMTSSTGQVLFGPGGGWTFEGANALRSTNAAGPLIQMGEAATSENPTLIPNRADPSTGVGWHSTSKLSLIADGTMAIALEATQITLATTAHFAGRIQMPEISVPTGAANYCFLYTYDTGGKTRLACKLGSDTEIVLATQA